uniref:DUF1985 domain-containing protein n=1 Tax=Cucumis melo TaxID=3656 RepID=A0A9I9EGI4_CUCME
MLDLNHVKMLDDKEKFRNYPWGRLCFSLTKQFILNAVKSKRKSKNSETESKACAFLQGFPMVLAYWAYEILPQLLSVVPIVASEEEMKSEYFRYFLELENDRLDEEACAMKESNMSERISSLNEDIKDFKKIAQRRFRLLEEGARGDCSFVTFTDRSGKSKTFAQM